MPERDYVVQLDDAGLDWIRYRFTTERGHVTRFTVQYETTIDGQRVAIVRYDNAHGFAHRDVLDRRGDPMKQALPTALTPAEALDFGQRDIRENWPHYRAQFLGDIV